MPPTLSFIVIAHNEAENIGRTLRSIAAQRGPSREVLVVNDGSTDDTAAAVASCAQADPAIRLINVEQNRGRGFARSLGVSQSRGRLIAMVDADIELPPDWLERCLAALETADVAGGIAIPDGDSAYLYSRFRLTPRVVKHVAAATGSNAVYKRWVFEHVQFDPNLRNGEDIALSHALAARGAEVVTVPGLLVRHVETKSLRESISWMFVSGRGAARQLYRYREIRTADAAFAAWLVAMLTVIVGRRRGRLRRMVLPLGAIWIIAGLHVRRAFEWDLADSATIAGAIAVDAVLITAYFTGRLAGTVLELPL